MQAGDLHLEGDIDVTEALIKIAGEWGLNKEQINRVVGFANHHIFANLSQSDKMCVFKVASTDEVYESLQLKSDRPDVEKMGSRISEPKKVDDFSYISPEMKATLDLHGKISDYRLVKKAHWSLIRQLYKLAAEKEDSYLSLYNTTLRLLKQGEPISEIWTYVSAVFDEDSGIKETFNEIVNKLHTDGYVSEIPDLVESEEELYVDKDTELYRELSKAKAIENAIDMAEKDKDEINNYLKVAQFELKKFNVLVDPHSMVPTRKLHCREK